MAVSEGAFVRSEPAPTLPAPRRDVGLVGWLRTNLFSSAGNTVTTLLVLLFLAWTLPPLVRWAIIDAAWDGTDRNACLSHPHGACWAFIKAKFTQSIYYVYPVEERWRVNLAAILLVIGLVPMAIPKVPYKRETIAYLLLFVPIASLILLTGGNFRIQGSTVFGVVLTGCFIAAIAGGALNRDHQPTFGSLALGAGVLGLLLHYLLPLFFGRQLSGPPYFGFLLIAETALALVGLAAAALAIFRAPGQPGRFAFFGVLGVFIGIALVLVILAIDFGLPEVTTDKWGGLMVTLVVALVGIAASLPLGILLALGRRSRLPVIRLFSVIFIEFWRGVPLITVLFMSSVMLPVFLPPGTNFDKLLRALIGVALFSSAYMAEVIRGGLQAIPRGQFEGAMALGLNYWQMMRLIVLPQALKLVIPGIVNSFISLFKDTSLVLIIGIFDLLGIMQVNFTDQNWLAPETPATGYAFAAFVFWVFCFGMSRYSIYTERRLRTGYRR